MINATFSQCKQLNENGDFREILEELSNQPAWIIEELDICDFHAINQGGCASGAYMPAVTYHQAIATMSEHGNDVMQYIEDAIGELPSAHGLSWSGLAALYVSTAVELFAGQFIDQLDGVDWD